MGCRPRELPQRYMLGSSSSGRLFPVEVFEMVFRLRSPLVGIRNMCLKFTSLLVDAMVGDSAFAFAETMLTWLKTLLYWNVSI